MILRRHRLKIQLQKKDSPTKLEKESTHMTISSKKYAYSADKIRKYITGEEPYKGEKLVFLTFDDGVNNQITPQVLDALKKYNVHATFFSCRKYPNFRKSKDSETRSCRRTFNRLS